MTLYAKAMPVVHLVVQMVWAQVIVWFWMTYFRISTSPDVCDNCGLSLSKHTYVTTDRDGDLHECPSRSKPQQRLQRQQSQQPLRTQLLALITLAHQEGLYDAADFVRQAMTPGKRRDT